MLGVPDSFIEHGTRQELLDLVGLNTNSLINLIDDYMNNWNQYDNNISDHRPIGIKLEVGNITSDMELGKNNTRLIKIVDILGRDSKKENNRILFYLYSDGTVEKKIILNNK